ncbi:hypothetical protein GCM10010378_70840 [Streptomyces viridochromogenes]
MTITDAIHHAVLQIPPAAWTAAVEPGGEIRDGAWVAELTGGVLTGWPKGIRLIVRKERPHPGAQLRLTDADGLRLTAFANNTTGDPIAALEMRHRQRARAKDRIRAARATGLRNLALHSTAQTRSGSRSSRSPSTWWPGCPCSLWRVKPAGGSPVVSDSVSSPPLPRSSRPPAAGA